MGFFRAAAYATLCWAMLFGAYSFGRQSEDVRQKARKQIVTSMHNGVMKSESEDTVCYSDRRMAWVAESDVCDYEKDNLFDYAFIRRKVSEIASMEVWVRDSLPKEYVMENPGADTVYIENGQKGGEMILKRWTGNPFLNYFTGLFRELQDAYSHDAYKTVFHRPFQTAIIDGVTHEVVCFIDASQPGAKLFCDMNSDDYVDFFQFPLFHESDEITNIITANISASEEFAKKFGKTARIRSIPYNSEEYSRINKEFNDVMRKVWPEYMSGRS